MNSPAAKRFLPFLLPPARPPNAWCPPLTLYRLLFLSREDFLFVSWGIRFVHVALDTFVLYGMLGTRPMDEGGDTLPSASVTSGTNSEQAPTRSDLPRPSGNGGMKSQGGFCTPRSPVSGGVVCSSQGSRRVIPSVQSE